MWYDTDMSRNLNVAIATALVAVIMAGEARAAQCGNSAGGYEGWKQELAREARAKGVGATGVAALMSTSYATRTIAADRGMKSFKLSLDQFLVKRGANAIVARGRSLKQTHAALLASIEQRYGVPPGPLLAIWGMETAFGTQRGNENMLSAVATLAYDCRRTEYFTDQLYAALTLIERGTLSATDARLDARRIRPDPVHAEEHPAMGRRQSRQRVRRAHLDGEFPQGPWLARGGGLSAGRAELCRHPGLERRHGLSAGDRPDGPPDRQRGHGAAVMRPAMS